MSEDTRARQFETYRYFKPKTHYSPKIALKVMVDNEKDELAFVFAVCSPEDNFSRSKARKLLNERQRLARIVIHGKYNRDDSLIGNIINIVQEKVDLHNHKEYLKLVNEFDNLRYEKHEIERLQSAFANVIIEKEIEQFLPK